jgi:hypothetical protein
MGGLNECCRHCSGAPLAVLNTVACRGHWQEWQLDERHLAGVAQHQHH